MTRLRLWTLKSSHPIMAINDKNEFPKTPTSYSPTVALIGCEHLKNSYYEKMID